MAGGGTTVVQMAVLAHQQGGVAGTGVDDQLEEVVDGARGFPLQQVAKVQAIAFAGLEVLHHVQVGAACRAGVAGFPDEAVGTAAAEQEVVALAANQLVVAALAIEDVVAVAAPDQVIAATGVASHIEG
ncbi:hypothetical protein D9M68_460350 [compost metagenome]